MIVYKNKRFYGNSDHPDDDWIGDADFVIPDGSELAEKIKQLYPNFDFVFGGDGNISDVVATDPEPLPPELPSDHDRLEALEAAFMEFVSEVM